MYSRELPAIRGEEEVDCAVVHLRLRAQVRVDQFTDRRSTIYVDNQPPCAVRQVYVGALCRHSLTRELDQPHENSFGLQALLEERDLGAFAGSVEALDNNERTTKLLFRHEERFDGDCGRTGGWVLR